MLRLRRRAECDQLITTGGKRDGHTRTGRRYNRELPSTFIAPRWANLCRNEQRCAYTTYLLLSPSGADCEPASQPQSLHILRSVNDDVLREVFDWVAFLEPYERDSDFLTLLHGLGWIRPVYTHISIPTGILQFKLRVLFSVATYLMCHDEKDNCYDYIQAIS